MSFTLWDAADNYAKMRETWPAGLYPNAEGEIFMVDATVVSPGKMNRDGEPSELLSFLLTDERIKGLPLLIMANKQDASGAMASREITEKLQLYSLANRNW